MKKENEIHLDIDEKAYLQERYERRRRWRISYTVVPLLFGILGTVAYVVFPPETLDRFGLYGSATVPLFILMAFGMSGTGLLMIYLQTGFSKSKSQDLEANYLREEFSRLRNKIEANNYSEQSSEEIESRIDELEKRFEKAINETVDLHEEDKAELVRELESSIKGQASSNILEEIRLQAASDAKKKSHISDFQQLNKQSTSRLEQEIVSLTRRGNLNLSLGIVTTLIGLSALSYFVLSHSYAEQDPTTEFITYFIPRVTLVIFVQIFAFFFLKLYRSTLDEIKFFQNEITNIELKSISLRAALEPEMQSAAPDILKALSNTERNYIIPKGQTTISLERDKQEYAHLENMSKQISEIAKAVKK